MAHIVSAIGLWLFIYRRTMEAPCLFLRELLSIDCLIAVPAHSKILLTVGRIVLFPLRSLGEFFSGKSFLGDQSCNLLVLLSGLAGTAGTAEQLCKDGTMETAGRILFALFCTPDSLHHAARSTQHGKIPGQNPFPSIQTSFARCLTHPLLLSSVASLIVSV